MRNEISAVTCGHHAGVHDGIVLDSVNGCALVEQNDFPGRSLSNDDRLPAVKARLAGDVFSDHVLYSIEIMRTGGGNRQP